MALTLCNALCAQLINSSSRHSPRLLELTKEPDYFLFSSCNTHLDTNICCDFIFFPEASRKGHQGNAVDFNSSTMLLWSFTRAHPQGHAPFPSCIKCNGPMGNDTAGPGGQVCRWSNDPSPFHFSLIKEKRPGILAEQKVNVLWGQSVVGLGPNYSTNYFELGQVS